MIATPRKKMASPPSRTSVYPSKRFRQTASSSMGMLPHQLEHVERLLGDRHGARVQQLLRLVIAPGRADRQRAGGRGHRHVEAGVADDEAGLRHRAGLGDR